MAVDLSDYIDAALPVYDVPEKPEEQVNEGVLSKLAAYDQNDIGNAYRLLAHFGNKILYVRHGVGWHHWAGTHWKHEDAVHALYRYAQQTADRIRLECRHIPRTKQEDEALAAIKEIEQGAIDAFKDAEKQVFAKRHKAWLDRVKARYRYSISSGNAAKVRNMIDLAAPHCSFNVNEMDVEPDGEILINVENGTLCIKKVIDDENPDPDGVRYKVVIEKRAADPSDKITRCAPVTYDPDAKCPKFDAFMKRFQPDVSTRDFIQTYEGYCLTGLTGEQVLFFHIGKGANGKSTFMETMGALRGDYSLIVQPETVTGTGQRQGGQSTPDLVRLPGVRYARIPEIPRGEPLRESLIKTLTGGEPITVRPNYGDFFDFRPEFKAVMSGNDYPKIVGTDEGIWRRILIIKWPVTIPVEQRRPMNEILYEMKQERSGILNWLLEGLKRYLLTGLQVPDGVRNETNKLREDTDLLQGFINACLNVTSSSDDVVSFKDLYEIYRQWWVLNVSDRPWTKNGLSRALKSKDFASLRKNDGIYFIGITIKQEALSAFLPAPAPPGY